MLLIFAGFLLSFLGSIPPGLISLTVAQTAIQRGLLAALTLSAGAAFAEFFQACVAVLFSNWFLAHPGVEKIFQWVAMFVFFALAAYLILIAKTTTANTDTSQKSRLGFFIKGLAISAFNLMAIPYWFVYCAWLRVEGWWQEGWAPTLWFAFGVSLGTVATLSLYAFMGLTIVRKSNSLAQKANQLVGWIFLFLGAKILWSLL